MSREVKDRVLISDIQLSHIVLQYGLPLEAAEPIKKWNETENKRYAREVLEKVLANVEDTKIEFRVKSAINAVSPELYESIKELE